MFILSSLLSVFQQTRYLYFGTLKISNAPKSFGNHHPPQIFDPTYISIILPLSRSSLTGSELLSNAPLFLNVALPKTVFCRASWSHHSPADRFGDWCLLQSHTNPYDEQLEAAGEAHRMQLLPGLVPATQRKLPIRKPGVGTWGCSHLQPTLPTHQLSLPWPGPAGMRLPIPSRMLEEDTEEPGDRARTEGGKGEVGNKAERRPRFQTQCYF